MDFTIFKPEDLNLCGVGLETSLDEVQELFGERDDDFYHGYYRNHDKDSKKWVSFLWTSWEKKDRKIPLRFYIDV